jgi:exo-beta-1,3-glucanase (GH17 family)
MSFRKETYLSYSETELIPKYADLAQHAPSKLRDSFLEILKSGTHGFCFSLYEEEQKPGDQITEAQIRKRLEILRPHTMWIRTFSCTEGNEMIPKIAKEYGMKALVGAWLGSDLEKNEEEIEGLIQMANQGFVDIAAVGNEVLYRKDLTEQQLLEYMRRVKLSLPNHPVGYVDAYYEFTLKPTLVEASDVILCNCYPYWEGTSIEYSFQHMVSMYQQAQSVAQGKKIIITETGWPSHGETLGGAVPSLENALLYFIRMQLWAKREGIESFYFSSFDEVWKTSSEGTVGAHWGIWDARGHLKF